LSTGHLTTMPLTNLALLGLPAWWTSDDDPQVACRFGSESLIELALLMLIELVRTTHISTYSINKSFE